MNIKNIKEALKWLDDHHLVNKNLEEIEDELSLVHLQFSKKSKHR